MRSKLTLAAACAGLVLAGVLLVGMADNKSGPPLPPALRHPFRG